MKDQLRKDFIINAGDLLQKNNLSEESIEVQTPNDVYYTKEHSRWSYRRTDRSNFNKINKINNKYKEFLNTETKQNPTNSQEDISRCNYCGSKYHWANNCPNLPEQLDNNL